ncbi:MAG: Loki-CTERM sorting domain-containing protein [Promethearchaeota archaeon]|jgi:uncharacterized delta-60 repeat protein
MKETKRKILIIFLIFYLGIILVGSNVFFNEKYESSNVDIENRLITSNLAEDSYVRIWGGSNDDRGEGVAVDSMDNIYLVGRTESFGMGDNDMILVKYSSSGVQQWNQTWGGSINDGGYGVAIDSSDNVYIAGYTESFGAGDFDMLLVKYNNSGVQIWNTTWGGSGGEGGYGVAMDSLGNIYVVGSIGGYVFGDTDMVLVKFNSSGVQIWNTTWGGNIYESGTGVAVDSSDSIYIAGRTNSFGAGDNDMVLVKYNSSGVQIWNKTWGGINSDVGKGVAVDSMDNIYLGGGASIFLVGYSDMALIKYDSSGVQLWNKTWGGGSSQEYGDGVAIDSLDNIYISGRVPRTGGGTYDMGLVKFDSSGVALWNKSWGGVMMDYDISNGVAVDSSNSVYIVGETEAGGPAASNMVLVKYNEVPKIVINSPSQNEFIGGVAPDFDISTIGVNINTTWYSLDNGLTDITTSGVAGIINQTEWDKKGDELITIRFFANNTLGVEGSAEVTIRKDITEPISAIVFDPHEGTNIVLKSSSFTLTADDGTGSGVFGIKYKINDSIWYDYIEPFNLLNFEYGNYIISYYAIDMVGNTEIINIIQIEIVPTPIQPQISGYNLIALFGICSVITVIIIKKKYKK